MLKMKYIFLSLIFFFSFLSNTWGEDILTEFLVAKPNMPDPRFKETVIFILYHNPKEGAAGLVINKPIEKISFSELFTSNNLSPPPNLFNKKTISLFM